MPVSDRGSILESMSTRKLTYLILGLSAVWLVAFVMGAVVSPPPNNSMMFLGTKCLDEKGDLDSEEWFYPRGKHRCSSITDFDSEETLNMGLTTENIVFAFQMPHVRNKTVIDFSRWQQILMGVLMLDIEYQSGFELDRRIHLLMKARLGYRDLGDPEDAWKPLVPSAVVQRNLDCDIADEHRKDGYYYNCPALSLFELGSLHHDFYLLNLRMPAVFDEAGRKVPVDDGPEGTELNKLGKLVDVHLVAIYQNGGFTKVWMALKTVFFPVILIEMIWYCRRIRQLPRPPTLLEKTIAALGIVLTLLNAPIEFFSLFFDWPWLPLLGEIKQGLFYATLMVFWLIFTGEHCINETGDTGEKNGLSAYWKNIAVVGVASTCFFLFDVCERGMQLVNPFDSIWATDGGTNLALAFVIAAGISAGVFFLFLCYKIYKVMRTLRQKQSAIAAMSSVRRLHYSGLVWRFHFLIAATLLTSAVTAVGFILGRVAEGQYKWDDDISVDYSAGLMVCVYSLWNCYVFALVFLYAPSHKNWAKSHEDDEISQNGEEIEFSVHRGASGDAASEISSLTEFLRHQATD